jgi:F0F1-type ATP synthase beta subunit
MAFIQSKASSSSSKGRVKSNAARREKHDSEISELQHRIDTYQPGEVTSFEQLPLSSRTVKGESYAWVSWSSL